MRLLQSIVHWTRIIGITSWYGSLSVLGGALTRRHAVSQWAMRRWSQDLLRGLGLQCDVLHPERLTNLPQCIFIANHESNLDILVLGSVLPGDYRWLAKAPLFKIPMLGWHLRFAGHVPVYRGEHKDKNTQLPARIHRAVQQGASLLFFPEGTRTRDGSLQPFRHGAFVAAVDEQLPIVPLVIRGTFPLLVKNSIAITPGVPTTCTVEVLEPIRPAPEGDARQRAQQLLNEAHAVFQSKLTRSTTQTDG